MNESVDQTSRRSIVSFVMTMSFSLLFTGRWKSYIPLLSLLLVFYGVLLLIFVMIKNRGHRRLRRSTQTCGRRKKTKDSGTKRKRKRSTGRRCAGPVGRTTRRTSSGSAATSVRGGSTASASRSRRPKPSTSSSISAHHAAAIKEHVPRENKMVIEVDILSF